MQVRSGRGGEGSGRERQEVRLLKKRQDKKG